MPEQVSTGAEHYLTSPEAAKRYRVTNDYVARLCRQGKLKGVLENRVWMVEENSLDSFFTDRDRYGEPRKKAASSAEAAQPVKVIYLKNEVAPVVSSAPVVAAVPIVAEEVSATKTPSPFASMRIRAGSVVAVSVLVFSVAAASSMGNWPITGQQQSALSASLAEVPVLSSVLNFFSGIFSPFSKHSAIAVESLPPVPAPPAIPAYDQVVAYNTSTTTQSFVYVTTHETKYVSPQYVITGSTTGIDKAYVDERIDSLSTIVFRSIDNAVGRLSGSSSSGGSGGGTGSITSIDVSGGTTGLSFAGGPITSAGTLTLSGVLAIDNGGTGVSSVPDYGKILLGNSSGGYDLVATSSLGIASGGNPSWGNIIGTLSAQTDLESALDAKLSRTDWYATTTDGLAQGVTNKYWSNTLFDNRLAATTTLPNLTTLANLSTVSTSLSGVLKAASGALTAATPGVDYENPLTFAYPLSRSANAISLAFGTTTSNTWALHNIFSSLFTTNASSTNATTSSFGLNGETFVDLTGAGLQNVGGVLTLNTAGDWTGTFDGQEGTYYLNRANQTGTQLASTISDFNASVNSYINASTTIPKTYSANTWTGLQTIASNLLTVSGVSDGCAAFVSGQFTSTGSPCGSGGGGGITALGAPGQTQTGGTQTFATSTSGGLSLTITSSSNQHLFTAAPAAGFSIPLTASTTDWNTAYLNRITSANSPLSISSNAISIANAVADGSTKGAASFTTNDFDSSSGNIALDYANGQKASASVPGFLASADWSTFNGKQGALTLTTTGSSGAATLIGNTLNIPQYAGTTYSAAYPITLTGSTFGLAFGTTTANTWALHNIFSSIFATNASSTNATTTSLGINNETFIDLTGAGLQNVGGALTLDATGNWTGTFDGQEGTYYLNRANHTGTQLASTISDFDASVNAYVAASTTLPKTYSTNVFTGANTFNQTITGSISGNAGTVTNGVYTTTFATLFDNRLAATTSVASITTLPSLSLPSGQVTGLGALATLSSVNNSNWSGAQLSVANGGTGQQTFTSSQLLYGNGTAAVSSVATTSFAAGSEFSYTGTLGALVGGANGTLSLSTNGTALSKLVQIAANSILGNSTGTSGNVTAIATSSLGIALGDTTGTLAATRGGTGQASYTVGDILYADTTTSLTRLPVGSNGTVLKVAGGVPTWGADITTGGGGGATAWATTSDSLAVYPTDTSNVVIVGSNATSSLTSIFEVHGKSYFSNFVGIGTTTPYAQLSVEGRSALGNSATAGYFTATTTNTNTFPYASTTLASVATGLYNSYLTATRVPFTTTNGLLTDSANLTFNGTTLTANTLALTNALTVANGGTGWAAIQAGSIPYGNGSGALATTTAGTSGYVLALNGSTPTWVATTTFSSGLAYAAGNVTNTGVLSNIAGTGINVSGATGNVTISNTGLLSLQQLGGGSAQTGAITLATSSQTTNGDTIGLNITNSSGAFTFAPTLSGTRTVAGGGTGVGTFTSGQLLYGNGTAALSSVATSTLAVGTGLTSSGTLGYQIGGTNSSISFAAIAANSLWANATGGSAVPTVIATSSLGIALSDTTGTLAVARGGTGQGTFTSGQILYGNGTTALSSVATSTLAVGNGLTTTSGTLGYQIGGSNASVGLAAITGNSVLGNITGASGVPTAVATSSLFTWNGTGNVVRDTSPTLTTPVLGAATYTTLNGGAITDSALTSGRVTYATTAGLLTDSANLTFNGTTLTANALAVTNGTTLSGALTYGGVTLANSVTGTGSMVLSTSPTLVTPALGTPSAVVLTNATGLPLGGAGVTGTLTVGNGGTGTTTAPISQLLYGGASGVYQSVATTSETLGSEFSFTGTYGARVGGTTGTLSLAANGIALSKLVTIAANSILGNSTGATGNVTAIATSSLGIALSDTTGTLSVARGGTGVATFTSGQLLYGNGTAALSSVGTSTLAVGTGLTSSGTLGYQIGGTNSSISFAAIAANSLWANQTGGSAVPTVIATSSLFVWNGTGNVVRDTSPTLTTPTLGVAAGTSLALNGATIGSNALAVTGTANISGATVIGGALTYGGVTLANSVTGTGSMVLSSSPTLTTPNLGTPSTLVLTNATGLPLGGAGVTGTLTVGNGGTGQSTFTSGQLLYGNGTAALSSVATTSVSGTSITVAGTGAVVGGSGLTVNLNLANANNWTALQSFALASSTLFSNTGKAYFGGTSTTTIDSAGSVSLPAAATLTLAGYTGILSSNGSSGIAARTITGTAGQITVTNGDGVSGNPTLSLPSTLSLTQASTTLFSVTNKFYAGGTATTTIDSAGNVVIPSTATLTYGGVTLSNSVTGTGSMVLSTSPTLVTPILGTPQSVTLTNATGLPLGGAGVTGTLTVGNGGTGTTTAPISQLLYGGAAGVYQSVATTSETLGSEFSFSGTSYGARVGGGAGTLTLAANGTALSKLVTIAANSILGNSTGSTGNVSVIATSSLGIALGDTTGTLSVARGGTGQATFSSGQLLYGNGTAALSSVATTSVSGTSITVGGTGAVVGGSGLTVNLNLANANSWTALQSFALASSTLFSNTGTAYFGSTSTTTISSNGSITLPAAASLTVGNLTSGRVPYIGTGGLFQDSANLTFNGTTLTANALAVTNGTTLSGALTYGGVTLANSVTGTGSMVLSASPTFTGTVNGAASIWSGNSTAAAFIPTGSSVPTNGLFLPAANTLGFSTNSTQRLTIASNGFVGVGTTSPWANLSIHAATGATNTTLFAIGSSTGSVNTTLFSVSNTGTATFGDIGGTGDANFMFASDNNAWSVGYNAVDKSFNIASSTDFTSNVAFTILKNNLNVGIASTTPYAQLSVGMASSTDAFILGVAGSTTPSFIVKSANSNGYVGIATSSPMQQLSIGGNLLVGAPTAGGANGTLAVAGLGTAAGTFIAADPSGRLIATTTPSISGTIGQVAYFTGTNTAAGTSTISIATNQNVGVSTTTPAAPFSVGGNVLIGASTAGGTNGTLTVSGVTSLSGATTIGGALTYGGVTLSNSVTGTGSMVLSTSPTLVTPNLGTPSAVVLTNGTGLPITSGVTGMGIGVTSFLVTPSSANLAMAMTDETGSGALVFGTSPTLVTPILGFASSTQLTVSGSTYLATAGGNVGIASSSPFAELSIGMASTTNALWVGVAGSTTPAFMISSANTNGFVGIGTSSPQSATTLLQIGTGSSGGLGGVVVEGLNGYNNLGVSGVYGGGVGQRFQGLIGGGTGDPTLYIDSDTFGGVISLRTSDAHERMRVDNVGHVGIGTTTPWATLSVSTTTANIAGQALFAVANSSNSTFFTVLGSGNIGVGTTSPSSLFSVGGNVIIGAATAGGTNGTLTYGGVTLANSVTGTGSMVLSTSPTLVTPVLGAATYTTLNGGNITDSGLTSGRVTYAGTAGLLQDSANLTFNGTTLTANTLALTNALTVANGGTGTTTMYNGGVTFYNSTLGTLSQSAAIGNFFWDETNKRLGLGTSTPFSRLTIGASSASASNFGQLSLTDTNAGTNLKHWLFSSMGGNFYLGTTTDLYATSSPAAFSITNSGAVSIGNTVSTTTIPGGLNVGSGGLQYDFSSGVASAANFQIGNLAFDTDAGQVTWTDMPVTANSTSGTVESYTANLNGRGLLTIYGQSDGAGDVNTLRVGIASTSPWGQFSINPIALHGAGPEFVIGSSTATHLVVDNTGKLGVGTTSPFSLLSVGGNVLVGAPTAGGANGTLTVAGLGTAAGTFLAADPSGRIIATTSPSGSSLTGTIGQVAYFTGTNIAAGTSTITIDTNQNVGIGTTTPAKLLSIGGNVIIGASSAGGTDGTLTYGGVTFSNTVTGSGSLVGSASPSFSGTVTMTNGNLRGGTTASSNLQINGTSNVAPNSSAFLELGLTSTAGGQISQLFFSTSGTSFGTTTGIGQGSFDFASSSISKTFKPQIALTDTNAGTNLKHFGLTSAGGLFSIDAISDAFATTTRLTIDASGNVGISSTTPSSLLSVGGNAFIGAATAGGTQGTLGIGTTTPGTGALLGVAGSAYLTGDLTLGSTAAQSTLTLFNSNNTVKSQLYMNSGHLYLTTATGGGSMFFTTSSGTGLTIGGTGNIGASTTTPSSTFSVGGNAFIGASTAGGTSGKLGVGIATPSYSVDVAGFVNVDQYSGYKQAGNTILYASSTNQSVLLGIGAGTKILTSAGIANSVAIGWNSLTGSSLTGTNNVAVGPFTGQANTTGTNNVFLGINAGQANTTGNQNVFTGENAGYANTTGAFNVFTGPEAGQSNITGTGNIFLGYQTGYYATTSSYNVAIGNQAFMGGSTDASGGSNVAIGGSALSSNRTGSLNTAVGFSAGFSNKFGTANTYYGFDAGYYATTSSYNTAIGYLALMGGSTDSSGSSNVALGTQALMSNRSGNSNTALGYSALVLNTTGSNNTAVGSALGANTTGSGNIGIGANLNSNTTGDYNTAIGGSALNQNRTGGQNVAYGAFSLTSNTTGTGSVSIGYQSTLYNGSATNTIAVGTNAGSGNGGGAFSAQGYTVVGTNAGYNFQTGSDYNTLMGYQAGFGVTTGSKNIYLGAFTSAGNANITTGSNNIIIGNDVQAPSATASNQLNIGNFLYGTDLDGTGSTISTGGKIGIGTTSPMAPFSVAGTGFQTGYGRVQGYFSGSNDTSGIGIANTNTGGGAYSLLVSNTGSGFPGGLIIANATTSTAQLVISASGRMGFGRDPIGDLTVNATPGRFIFDDADHAGGTVMTLVGRNNSVNLLLDPGNNGGGLSETIRFNVADDTGTRYDGADITGVTTASTNGAPSQELRFYTMLSGTNAQRMVIRDSGKVGIGVSSPITQLELLGSTTQSSLKITGLEMQGYAVNNEWLADNMYHDGSNWKYRANGYAEKIYFLNGDIMFDTSASGSAGATATVNNRMLIAGSTGVVSISNLASCGGIQTNGAGAMSCTSDARLKDIQGEYTAGLSALRGITPETYSWKQSSGLYDGGILYSGFIAQNVEANIPGASNTGANGYKQINTTTILAAAINGIKELDTRTLSLAPATDNAAHKNLDISTNANIAGKLSVSQSGVFAGSLSAGSYIVSASEANGISYTLDAATTTVFLPSTVLADGGNVNITKVASLALAGVEALTARTDMIIERLDSLEDRLAMLETGVLDTGSDDEFVATTTVMEQFATSSEGFVEVVGDTLKSLVDAAGTPVRNVGAAIQGTYGFFDGLFAKKVHTEVLCVSDDEGETCITKAQLDALLTGAAAGNPPSGNGGGTPPGDNGTTTDDGTGGDASSGDDSGSGGDVVPPPAPETPPSDGGGASGSETGG